MSDVDAWCRRIKKSRTQEAVLRDGTCADIDKKNAGLSESFIMVVHADPVIFWANVH